MTRHPHRIRTRLSEERLSAIRPGAALHTTVMFPMLARAFRVRSACVSGAFRWRSGPFRTRVPGGFAVLRGGANLLGR